MPLTSAQQTAFNAALSRLASFYDGDNPYNPATYPGAFRQGGSVINYVPSLKDVATVMQYASTLVADATAASGASPKALRVDSAQSFSLAERLQGKQNLGSMGSGVQGYSAAANLTYAAVIGRLVFSTGSTPYTLTLPAMASLIAGDGFEFINLASAPITLAPPDSAVISAGASNVTFVTLYPGQGAIFRTDGTNWYAALHAPVAAALLADRVQSFTTDQIAQLFANLGLSDRTPGIGDLVITLGNAAPAGTLALNGALYSRTTYAALWAWAQAKSVVATDAAWTSNSYMQFSSGDGSTTFRLPDLRGEFPRFWDNGRGLDNGRTLLSLQGSQLPDHQHETNMGNLGGNIVEWTNDWPWGYNTRNQSLTRGRAGMVNEVASQTVDAYTSGAIAYTNAEIRPRNVSMLACVRYK